MWKRQLMPRLWGAGQASPHLECLPSLRSEIESKVFSCNSCGRAQPHQAFTANVKQIFINLLGQRHPPLAQSAHLEKLSPCRAACGTECSELGYLLTQQFLSDPLLMKMDVKSQNTPPLSSPHPCNLTFTCPLVILNP